MESANFVVGASVFLGPAISGIAAIYLVWLVHAKKRTWIMASIYFFLTVLAGLISSFAYLLAHSHLLSGDGAMIIGVQPMLCLVFNIPGALIFFVCLLIVVRINQGRDLINVIRALVAAYTIVLVFVLSLPLKQGFGDGSIKIYATALTLPWSLLPMWFFSSIEESSPLVFWLLLALSGTLNILLSMLWLEKYRIKRRDKKVDSFIFPHSSS